LFVQQEHDIDKSILIVNANKRSYISLPSNLMQIMGLQRWQLAASEWKTPCWVEMRIRRR